MEKYDPEQSYKWQLEKQAQSRVLAEKFVEYFVEQGDSNCHGLCLDQDPHKDYDKLVDARGDEISGAPLFGFDANMMTLYLKNIPVNVSRWRLLDAIRETKGFVSFSMSEPLKAQDFERYAWISYDTDENCAEAKDHLENITVDNYRLNPVASRGTRKNIQITPELLEESIDRDLELCKRLILGIFDPEKEIPKAI